MTAPDAAADAAPSAAAAPSPAPAPAPSLTRHLIAWVLGALIVVWVSFMVVGYRTGQIEADELTDGHLASVAALVLSYTGGEFAPASRVKGPFPESDLRAHDYQQSMNVVVWDASGKVVTRHGTGPLPGFDTPDGFMTLRLGDPPSEWRAFTHWDAAHAHKAVVLLSLRERDDLAEDIAQQMTEPGFWLLPVVALMLGLAIRRGLKPLYALSQEVQSLDIHHARPLATPARHAELRAAVHAIDTLVDRYHAALGRERDFASELAHELRTPLASVSLQAHALRTLEDGPQRREALERLERDALRAGEVLSHLLALARANRAPLDDAVRPVDVQALARSVLAEFAPSADESGHVLALSASGPMEVEGNAVLLELALRNLVENAISHTTRRRATRRRPRAAAAHCGWA
jgi:two-component system sensor histidine kinase QseC